LVVAGVKGIGMLRTARRQYRSAIPSPRSSSSSRAASISRLFSLGERRVDGRAGVPFAEFRDRLETLVGKLLEHGVDLGSLSREIRKVVGERTESVEHFCCMPTALHSSNQLIEEALIRQENGSFSCHSRDRRVDIVR